MRYYLKELNKSLFVTLFYALVHLWFGEKPSIWHYVVLFLASTGLVFIIDFLGVPLLIKLKDFIRKRWAKVAVLDGSINGRLKEYPCELVWTKISPVSWEMAIGSFLKWWDGQRIESIPTAHVSREYSLIINPFGDNYPEEELKTKKTFYELCRYVFEGGILVVTGGAFYWHQNPKTMVDKQQTITKIIIQQSVSMQSLTDTVLFQEFGVLTMGGEKPIEKEIVDALFRCNVNNQKMRLFRPAMIEGGKMNYIPLLRQKDDKNILPAVAVRYGKGFLLHIGLFLESPDSVEFKITLEIIRKLVERKFRFCDSHCVFAEQ